MKNVNKKKLALVLTLCMLCAVAAGLVGCMRTGDEVKVDPSPSSQPFGVVLPDMGINGGADNAGANGKGMSGSGTAGKYDWKTGAEAVEANISRLSEVAESRVVVTGTTALVGVKFTSAYKGENTERIREMIAGVVRRADPSIQTVAVTSQPEDVDKIYAIAEELRAGASADDKAEDINRIVRNATTLR